MRLYLLRSVSLLAILAAWHYPQRQPPANVTYGEFQGMTFVRERRIAR